MTLFFNYSIDCELPTNTEYTGPERRDFFGGPESWEFAERSVRGFVERMDGLGAGAGATLFVYPDVTRHQAALYREMADSGVETALHLNGLRYSRLRGSKAKWLGEMTGEEQSEALRIAKADLEDTLGRSVHGYRSCYGSANDDTFRICEELGFEWASNSSARNRPEFFAVWAGNDRCPHFASSRNNLEAGDLSVYEIPLTAGHRTFYEGNLDTPLDLRVETPVAVTGEQRELLRRVIDENIDEMERLNSPVRAIIGGSHNTSLYGDVREERSKTLEWVVRHADQAAAERGLDFTPMSFEGIKQQESRAHP